MKKWLIIYDIKNGKRLNKIAKIISEYGERVQQSVFECEANDKALGRIRMRVNKIITEEDYVVYFDICENDWQKRMKYGPKVNADIEEKSFYII
ncbi:MAG: CRISPR-associated endonuclease Cas2 [bacterium]